MKNERSLIPLIIISFLVSAPLIFILGLVFGSQMQLSNILTADSLSSWVTALATVSIAVLTFILAKETWYLRETQISQVNELRKESIRPNITITLKPSPVSFNQIIAEVQNFGKGIARNVRFFFKDRNGTNIEYGENPVVDSFLDIYIFSGGIASLGISQKIETFLFSFYDLRKKLPEEDIFSPQFHVEIAFEDVEGNAYYNEIEIDFHEYQGISSIGDAAPLNTIAQDITKLRQQFEQMTSSSFKRLNVNTYNSNDRKEERERQQEKINQWRKRAEENKNQPGRNDR